MAFRFGDVVGLIWSHPIVSVVVLLLFTPPLFPVVVFFSPLLISTALVILAMVSMGSEIDETPSYSGDATCKRGWIQDDLDNGRMLFQGERHSKRLRDSSTDDSWFEKVRDWEGAGRTWVDSMMSLEAPRKSGSSFDDNAAIVPFEGKAAMTQGGRRALDSDESKDTMLNDDDDIEEELSPPNSPDVAAALTGKKSGDQPRRGGGGATRAPARSRSSSEIVPEIESEGVTSSVNPRKLLPSLFRGLSLPKSLKSSRVLGDAFKNYNVGLKEVKAVEKPVEKVPLPLPPPPSTPVAASGTDATDATDKEIKIAPDENLAIVVSSAEQRSVEDPRGNFEDTPRAVLAIPATRVEGSMIIGGLQGGNPEITEGKEVHFDAAGVVLNEAKALEIVSGDGAQGCEGVIYDKSLCSPARPSSSGGARETKSSVEALVPPRKGKTSGEANPSAAVALSEKLKVPLEDIMSLLAGDKECVPSSGGGAVVVSTPKSSSSETTTSQEEEWSDSDQESPEQPPAQIDNATGTFEEKMNE